MHAIRPTLVLLAIMTRLASSWAEETHENRTPPMVAGKQQAGTEQPAAKRPGFTISKDTTYITEPLTADGYPDYFTAWERERSRGVTPENNAVAVLMQAFGPRIVRQSQRAEFFRKLKVTPPPEDGKYFVSHDEFTANRPQAKDDTRQWLAEIDQALNVAVEASKRSRWYEPLLAGCEPSMCLCAGSAFACSEDLRGYRPFDLAFGLLFRAAYRAEDGKFDDALQDLLAAHRLARLISQDPWDRACRSIYAIDAMACELDGVFARSGKTPLPEAEQYLRKLRQLGPPTVLAQQFEAKRYRVLEAMTRIRRNGNLVLTSFAGEAMAQDPEWQEMLARASESDQPLKLANALVDLLISAAREPTFQKRLPKMQLFQFFMEGGVAGRLSLPNGESPDKQGLPVAVRETAEFAKLSQISRACYDPNLPCGQPALTMLIGLRDQHLDEYPAEVSLGFYPPFVRQSCAAARFELAIITWALAAYRAECGQYPETLSHCCPGYLPQMPRDPFHDAPLVYRREGDSFTLYSVGPNGQDDEGKNSEFRLDAPLTDDISLSRTEIK